MEKLVEHFIPFECGIMLDELPEGFHDRANRVGPGYMITLFPEVSAIVHACSGTHASKSTYAIYCTCKLIVFSLFVLLLLHISHMEKYVETSYFLLSIQFNSQGPHNMLACWYISCI